MNTEESRKEFELSGLTSRLYRNNEPGRYDEYEDPFTQFAWVAWQAAKAQPQWIPVSERLPEYGTNVLIVVDGETEAENQVFEFKSGKWSSSGFFESNKDDGRYYYVREVEYWAPLPAAPE